MLVTWLSFFFSLLWFFFFNLKYLPADINFPTKRRNHANLWANESVENWILISLSLSLGKGGCCKGSGCDLWVWLVFVIYRFGLCWLCIVYEEIYGMKRKMTKREMELFWFWFGFVLMCTVLVWFWFVLGLWYRERWGWKEEKEMIWFFWGRRMRSVGESYFF